MQVSRITEDMEVFPYNNIKMDVIPHIDFLEADWENVPNVIPMYVRMIIDRVNKSTKWIAEAKDAP